MSAPVSRMLTGILLAGFCITIGLVSCSTRPYKMKRAEYLYRQGQVYLSKGDQEKAIKKFQDSLELASLAGFEAGIAHNKNEIAIIYTTRGQYDEARGLLTQSLEIYRNLNMKPEVSKTLNNIALTYLKEGQFHEALRRYETLLAWDTDTENMLGVGLTLYNMGTIYKNQLRQPAKAQEKYREALEIFKTLEREEYIQLVEKAMRGH